MLYFKKKKNVTISLLQLRLRLQHFKISCSFLIKFQVKRQFPWSKRPVTNITNRCSIALEGDGRSSLGLRTDLEHIPHDRGGVDNLVCGWLARLMEGWMRKQWISGALRYRRSSAYFILYIHITLLVQFHPGLLLYFQNPPVALSPHS